MLWFRRARAPSAVCRWTNVCVDTARCGGADKPLPVGHASRALPPATCSYPPALVLPRHAAPSGAPTQHQATTAPLPAPISHLVVVVLPVGPCRAGAPTVLQLSTVERGASELRPRLPHHGRRRQPRHRLPGRQRHLRKQWRSGPGHAWPHSGRRHGPHTYIAELSRARGWHWSSPAHGETALQVPTTAAPVADWVLFRCAARGPLTAPPACPAALVPARPAPPWRWWQHTHLTPPAAVTFSSSRTVPSHAGHRLPPWLTPVLHLIPLAPDSHPPH